MGPWLVGHRFSLEGLRARVEAPNPEPCYTHDVSEVFFFEWPSGEGACTKNSHRAIALRSTQLDALHAPVHGALHRVGTVPDIRLFCHSIRPSIII